MAPEKSQITTNCYITTEKLEELKKWAKTKEGKKKIVEICNNAYDNAKEIREMTSIDRAALKVPYTI